MPGLSLWHFLAAAIMSSQVAGGLSPMRSLRQTICHVSPRSGRPYVFASGLASPVWFCGYWPYAARKYGSYCDVSMFFLTKSVMSRIDPLVTASPMFCESRTGMSKFVLCAANCVKIASCHCAFGTVLTLMVTFGRVFVYSLPSSSSACAGGHSNHRNESVIGLSVSVPLTGALLSPPPLSPPPHATSKNAAATTAAAAATTRNVDLILSSSTIEPGCRLGDPSRFRRNLRRSCISCQLLCVFLAHFSSARYCAAHGHDNRATALRRRRPGHGEADRVARVRRARRRARRRRRGGRGRRRVGGLRSARARRDPATRVRADDRAHR